jgi:hypothetical protein
MKLLDDWKHVVRKAWSIKLMLLAGLMTGCEAILPLVTDWVPLPRTTMAAIVFFVVMGAFVARLLVQNGRDSDK